MSATRWFYRFNETAWLAYDDESNEKIENEFQKMFQNKPTTQIPNKYTKSSKIYNIEDQETIGIGEVLLYEHFLVNIWSKKHTNLNTDSRSDICRAVWFISKAADPTSSNSNLPFFLQPIFDESTSNTLDVALEIINKSSNPNEKRSVTIDSQRYVILKKSTIYHKVEYFTDPHKSFEEYIYRGYEYSTFDCLTAENKMREDPLKTTNFENITQNKWLDLPIDVWKTILGYLEDFNLESLASLCMTCQFFNKLMPDEMFWKNLYAKRYGIEMDESYQSKRQKQFRCWKQKFGFQFVIDRNLHQHFGMLPTFQIVSAESLTDNIDYVNVMSSINQQILLYTVRASELESHVVSSYGKLLTFSN